MAVRICMGVDPIGVDGESRMTVVTLCGDLNCDEPLSTADVALALQMAANNTDIDFSADVNSDGVVTLFDAPLIWQSMISKAAPARHSSRSDPRNPHTHAPHPPCRR